MVALTEVTKCKCGSTAKRNTVRVTGREFLFCSETTMSVSVVKEIEVAMKERKYYLVSGSTFCIKYKILLLLCKKL